MPEKKQTTLKTQEELEMVDVVSKPIQGVHLNSENIKILKEKARKARDEGVHVGKKVGKVGLNLGKAILGTGDNNSQSLYADFK